MQMGVKMIILEILVWLLLIFYISKNLTVALFLGGIIWISLSFIYEKKIWSIFFREHLRDRIASYLLVFMYMVLVYIYIYSKVGISCIIISILECLFYQSWRTIKIKSVLNFIYLLGFITSFIIFIFC